MSEFKVGDKVRFTEPGCGSQFEARRVERTVGTVVKTGEDDWLGSIKVNWKDGRGYSGGIGTSPKNHLEHVFKVGGTYKYTDSSGTWFTIELDHRSGSGDGYHTFVGTVQDRGTFYASPSFDNMVWGSYTHVDTDSLSEIEPEEIKTVNETKLPSFLVHADDVHSRVLYPFHAESTAVRDAEDKVVLHVSGEDTSHAQDIELAQFFVDAINEKIERDK